MIIFDFIYYKFLSKPHSEGAYLAGMIVIVYMGSIFTLIAQLFLFLYLGGSMVKFDYFLPLLFTFGFFSAIIEKYRYTVERIQKLDRRWSEMNNTKQWISNILIFILTGFVFIYNYSILPNLIIEK